MRSQVVSLVMLDLSIAFAKSLSREIEFSM